MSQNGFFFRTIGFLFLIGLLALIGFMAYRAGVAQGIAQAPAVADAIQGERIAIRPLYGFGFPPFGIVGGICLSVLLVFFFFGFMKFVFCAFRRRAGLADRRAAMHGEPTL
jgi:hypothetical protein